MSKIHKSFMQAQNTSFGNSVLINFISNMYVAVCNYIVIFLVSRYAFDSYSLWVSITSLLATLGTLGNGMFLNLVRSVGVLPTNDLKKKIQHGIDYEIQLLRNLKYILIILPLLTILIYYLLPGVGILYSIILVSYIISNFYFGLRPNILLGALMLKEYSIANTLSSTIKVIITFICLINNFNIWALIIGMICNVLTFYLLSVYLSKPKSKSDNSIESPISNSSDRSYPKLIILNTLALFLLSNLLNLAPLISINLSFLTNSEKTFFAIIFTFGQILHFASIAGLDSMVAYFSHPNSIKQLLQAWLLSFCVSTVGVVVLYFTYNLFLTFLSATKFLDGFKLFVYYYLFIVFFNFIYISVMYLIAKKITIYSAFILPGILIIISSQFVFPILLSLISTTQLYSNLQLYIIILIVAALIVNICLLAVICSNYLKSKTRLQHQ